MKKEMHRADNNQKPSRRKILAAAIGATLSPGISIAAPVLGNSRRGGVNSNAWVEVDLDVFEKNLYHVQGTLSGETKLCAILKADAYGVGIDTVMPSLLKAKIPCIGIASTEEARLSRALGFRGRVLRVRGATPGEIEAALPYDVEELVGNLALAQVIGEIGRKHRRTIRMHLCLNAGGMSRNGLEVSTDSGKEDAKKLSSIPGTKIVGIMTHFSVNDRAEVLKSLSAFNEEVSWIFSNTSLERKKVTLHTANSFATLNVPESHLDMVRPGGALYGSQGPRPMFQSAMSFKSRVSSVNSYPAGNTVSYDRTFKLERNSLLANIPVGFSDGYRRANSGPVLIKGMRAPVIGKITMNTLMVDVTDIGGIKPGDEVVLYGKQGDGEISKADIEKITGVLLADQSTVWGNSNPKIVKRSLSN